MGASRARTLALEALGRARREHRWVRDCLRSLAARHGDGPRDVALALRLAFGAVACEGLLDALIDERVRRPSSVEPRLRDSLRLSAFEVLYLGTPEPVAVSQGVELARSVAPRAAGLSNAVLRRLAPLRGEVAAARVRVASGSVDFRDLSLVSGLPTWLLARLARDLDASELSALALAVLESPPTWVAAVGDRAGESELAASGIEAEAEPVVGCLRVDGASRLAGSHQLGRDFVAADLCAQEVALLSQVGDGGRRLEVGCGRGTKTCIAAAAQRRHGRAAEFVCLDASASRLREARALLATTNAPATDGDAADAAAASPTSTDVAVTLVEADGRDLPAALPDAAGTFDVVLLDAPCTGTGTLRRHPEIAWSLRESALDPDDPRSLVSTQARLLEAAAAMVRPGGCLLYSTCSALREENEDQVLRLLTGGRVGGFALAPVDALAGHGDVADALASGRGLVGRALGDRRPEGRSRGDVGLGHRVLDDRGAVLRSTPSPEGPDLHFLAVLRRES